MKNEKEFYVIMQYNAEPYSTYYLTHDLFYMNYNTSYSFQDDCLFGSYYLEDVKQYLEKDSKEYNYTYKIMEVEKDA